MSTMIARPIQAVTGTCPVCRGTFETCRCGARPVTDTFHQLVDRLVAEGDDRARAAGRRAHRTLSEMAPGYTRQPVLHLTRPLAMREANDVCPLCLYWTCRCGKAVMPSVTAPKSVSA